LTGSAAGSGSSYIGWKKNRAVPDSAVPALQPSPNQSIGSKNVVQLELSFAVDKLVLEIEREAAPVLKFQILDTSATIRMKSATLHGGFQIGACLCEHGRFRMPDGAPIRLLCTEGAAEVEIGHAITFKNKAFLVAPLTDEFLVIENVRITNISLILNSHTVIQIRVFVSTILPTNMRKISRNGTGTCLTFLYGTFLRILNVFSLST
jgi:hypothetical protein